MYEYTLLCLLSANYLLYMLNMYSTVTQYTILHSTLLWLFYSSMYCNLITYGIHSSLNCTILMVILPEKQLIIKRFWSHEIISSRHFVFMRTSHENILFSWEHRMRTFCSHKNISWKHFYLMQTFVENKFVLMRVFVQTTWMKMFADVRGP